MNVQDRNVKTVNIIKLTIKSVKFMRQSVKDDISTK